MIGDTIELHFIDGPLAGTRKMEHKSVISRNRTYRYLQPTNYGGEQKVPMQSNLPHVQLVCIEYQYIPIPIPRSYNGPERFAMILEAGAN